MPAGKPARVIIALSGGVDSAVAALCLLRAGYRVEALHMTNWDDADEHCTAGQDLADARQVCADLGIPLHHANFAREYREQVFAGFLAEYRAGRTPNPDVDCNRFIKFGTFLRHAVRLGADLIATGHYARVTPGDDVRLLKAVDGAKDQTYFLHAVPRAALARTLFPLGELTKPEVRRAAAEAGLANHAKRDSTGICFVGKRPFREFLARYLPAEPGPIVTPEGRLLGRHEGLPYYTLGQRQGLGIGGLPGGGDEPWYVADKDPARNALVVVQGNAHPLLASQGLQAGELHWVNGPPTGLRAGRILACAARTRYRQPEAACEVAVGSDGRLTVRFAQPQWAVTPGQHVVFYAGAECLGGGTICSRQPLDEARAGAAPATA
jgi:tRNA-uridine 2-sulfurtransferase